MATHTKRRSKLPTEEMNRILKAWGKPKAPEPKKKLTPAEELAKAIAAMKKGSD